MKDEERQRVIAALSSNVEEIRYRAVQKFLEEASDIPVPEVLMVLGDESWRVRKCMVEAIVTIDPQPGLVEGLLGALGEEDNAGLRNSASEVMTRMGRPAVPGLVDLLEKGDKDQRKLAADILGDIADKQAVEPLKQALADQDENVRAASAEALGMIGDRSVIERLVQLLSTDGLIVQLSCLDALDRLQAKVPADTLESLLSTGPLRPHIFRLLGKLPGGTSVAVLVEGLQARGRGERAAAAQALAQQYLLADKRTKVEMRVSITREASDKVVKNLKALLESPSAEDREAAIIILGWTGREDIVDDLLQVARDDSVRELVQESLLLIGPKAVSRLERLAGEMGRAERVLALELLGHFGEPSSRSLIVEFSLSEDPEVSEAARSSLSKLGDVSVISVLIGFLKRNPESFSKGLVDALVTMGNKFPSEVSEAIGPLLDDQKIELRRAAAAVVCGIARKTDLQEVERLAGNQDSQIRAVAVAALGKIGEEEVLKKLRVSLADESQEVRLAAARSIGMHDCRDAHQILTVALKDSDPWVVREALEALGRCRDASLGGSVQEFVEHDNGLVAMEAVRALNRLGWREDSDWLEKACAHRDPEVVKEAISGCLAWPVETVRPILVAALQSPLWDVRMAATKAIGSIDDPELKRAILERVQAEEDDMVREKMEYIIGGSDSGSDGDR